MSVCLSVSEFPIIVLEKSRKISTFVPKRTVRLRLTLVSLSLLSVDLTRYCYKIYISVTRTFLLHVYTRVINVHTFRRNITLVSLKTGGSKWILCARKKLAT